MWDAADGLCEDAEGDHDDHDPDHGDCDSEAHLNVDGLILEYNGTEVYSQFQGAITGSLNLHVDETVDLSVHFLDQNGNEIESDPECYVPTFTVNDSNILSLNNKSAMAKQCISLILHAIFPISVNSYS